MDIDLLSLLVGTAVSAVFGIAGFGLARRSAAASERQNQLTEVQIYSNWLSEFRDWAMDVIAVMSRGIYLLSADSKAADPDWSMELRIELSSLIERGRLLLPNQDKELHGTHKLPAYRGYRHSVLDPVMAALRVCEGQRGAFTSQADALFGMRRHFVSGVQRIIDPESANRMLATIIKGAGRRREADTVGGLVAGGNVPRGATALLEGGPDDPEAGPAKHGS